MATDFQKRLERAEVLIQIARYREAIVELSALAALEPQNYTVLGHLSECHYYLDEPRRALEFARDAVAAYPGEWGFRLLSHSYRAIGLGDKALEAAQEAVKIAPDHPYALQTLVYAQIYYLMPDHAAETAELLLKVAPYEAETHDVLGYLEINRENYAAAERHFLKALEIDPESANAHNNLGLVYLRQSAQPLGYVSNPGKGRMARDQFRAALKIRPTLIQAEVNLRNAEGNPNFPGGKSTRFFIKLQSAVLLTTILARVCNGYIPNLINLFIPYRPRMFTVWINLVFIIFIVLWGFATLIARGTRTRFLAEKFQGQPGKTGAFLALLFLLQFVYAFFVVFMDLDLSGVAWLLLIILIGGTLTAAFRIFAYFDARVED